ncbi:MAG: glycerophosphodiester phosphodiesterase [Bacteroidaceae bacterium]|nr:glycerophosphodiester phosphodiesterase [Bacteroidaceae bacterium]
MNSTIVRKSWTAAFLLLLAIPSFSKLSAQERRTHEVGIIAHRGYWRTAGSSQNSRVSLQKAQDLDLFGSEIDVWLTTDGVVMVNHDNKYDGVVLEKSTSDVCRQLVLSNGEFMPTLPELLELIATRPSGTKLIIEVKPHSTPERDRAAADSAMALVRRYGLEREVEYISFSLHACNRLVQNDAKAKVAYLNGDKAPAELHALGHAGIDYHVNAFRKHPEWVAEAHALGMYVNVWTVDDEASIQEMIRLGVDYITTNEPVRTRRLIAR